MKLLVSAGVDVNVRSYGGTALRMARGQNHVEIVKTLLAAGAIDSHNSSSDPVESFVNSRTTSTDAPSIGTPTFGIDAPP